MDKAQQSDEIYVIHEDRYGTFLEVSIGACEAFGLQRQITGYSRCDGVKLYLNEERGDMYRFTSAWENHTGHEWELDAPFKIVMSEYDHKVRNARANIPTDLVMI